MVVFAVRQGFFFAKKFFVFSHFYVIITMYVVLRKKQKGLPGVTGI
jgi:hypothetical protein